MAILTHSGRAALAAAVKDETLHLALGRGQSWWDTSVTVVQQMDDQGRIALPHAPIVSAVVQSADGAATYVAGADYTIDAQAGVIRRVDSGAISAGATLKISATYGRPVEDVTSTALADEVCRRLVDEVHFVVPAPDGEISLTTGRYRISNAPTPHLFLRTKFDFGDAAGVTVREQAIFVGTVPVDGLPPGQRLLTPAQISSPGVLLLIEHSPPIVRQVSTRETFEFVLTF